MVRSFDLGVLLVESENPDLVTRAQHVERHEATELSDQRAVVEIAEVGVSLNLAA